MDDYIKRADALDAICDACTDYKGPGTCAGCLKVKDVRDTIPAADVVPVVPGRWVIINDTDGYADYSTAVTVTPDTYDTVRDEHPGYSEPRCFECHGKALLNGAEEYVLSAFCPDCGAKMYRGADHG